MSERLVLFVAGDIWHLGVVQEGGPRVEGVPLEPGTSLETRAQLLGGHLNQHGYAGEPVVLALPSAWCLCATVSTEGLERRRFGLGK